MPSHCNSYGFSAGFAAICAAISWYLFQDRACTVNLSYVFSETIKTQHLQMFHMIAIVVGAVLFVLSFFDFASVLYEVSLLFLVACLAIFASAVMMFYTTYMTFHISCKSFTESIADAISGSKNVIEAGDQAGITIMSLDLICALLLISAAISFSRTY